MEFASDIRRKNAQDASRSRVRSQVTPQQVRSNRTSSTVSRVLNFNEENHRGMSSSSFYGSSSRPTGAQYWQPGETLPIDGIDHHSPPLQERPVSEVWQNTVTDVLKHMEGAMTRHFATVTGKLDDINARMNVLETRQKTIESGIQAPVSSPSPTVAKGKRKRVTPTALQGKIRKVYASFDEKQFNLTEPINSKHNSALVDEITKAIGTEKFSEEQIQKGCKTYKKTLTERDKQTSESVKEKKRNRSMQQRSYERRGKKVRGDKEMKYWQEVTPLMMSDEEEKGDEYVRHPPNFRSELLDSFIEKLESRCDKTPSSQPRKKRVQGSPHEKSVPAGSKNWCLKAEFQTGSKSTDTETPLNLGSDNERVLHSDEDRDSEEY